MTKFTQQEVTLFSSVLHEATAAGYAAGTSVEVQPMRVYQSDLTGRQLGPIETVADGPCGFAWVQIKPANKRFSKWLKEAGYADSSYEGGLTYWISAHGQSYTRKYAHAQAMVKVFEKHFPEIRFYSGCRMD